MIKQAGWLGCRFLLVALVCSGTGWICTPAVSAQSTEKENDVIEGDTAEVVDAEERVLQLVAGDGKYKIKIDTLAAPELTDWARDELAPVVVEWYPKIVELLPSDGYSAPDTFSITFSPEFSGVAFASGRRISGAATWFAKNLKGEAKGAIVHEMVHVVQQYGSARRGNRQATRPPGWLTEGIADYVRWFLYEPESGGAKLTTRSLPRARHDASYRVSANFLDWLVANHDPEFVRKLNAEIRQGTWRDEIWEELSGKSVVELERDWKQARAKELGIDSSESSDSDTEN